MNCRSIISQYILGLMFLFAVPVSSQWVKSTGTFGGITQCLAWNGNDLFVGTKNGVYRSTNRGQTWNPANSGMTGVSVNALATDGTNVIAGTPVGVFLSSNGGESWASINTGLNNLNVSSIVLVARPSWPTYFFATAWDSGIYRSTNDGASWSQFNTGLPANQISALCSYPIDLDSSILVAAVIGRGVFRSTDYGESWSGINNGLPAMRPSMVFAYALAQTDSSLFVGTDQGVYRSTDVGASWTKFPGSPDGVVEMTVYDSSLIASDGINVFRVALADTAWTDISRGLPRNVYRTTTVHSFTFIDPNLYVATDAGVLSSSNCGADWTNVSNGLDLAAVKCLTANGSDVYFTGQGGYNAYRSNDSGSSWTNIAGLTDYQVGAFAVSGSRIVAGTVGPRMMAGSSPALLSSDNGATWSVIENSPAPLTAQPYGINDQYIFSGMQYGYGGVYRCSVDSSIWGKAYGGPPWWGMLTFRSVCVSGPKVYVGTDDLGVYFSSDNGVSWRSINTGLDTVNTSFSAIALNGPTIFVGTASTSISTYVPRGVYRSTNNGLSWSGVNAGLPRANISALAVQGSKVFAGTDSNGIFLSTDNGEHWSQFNEGLPNLSVSSLARNESYVYVGVVGGVWRLPLSEAVLSVSSQDNKSPATFSLGQNFPNPFNPSTSIRYQLPAAAPVTLKVYDILGREVQTLVNERQNAGVHSVIFDAGDLSSGVYFYTLQAERFKETKKFLLLK